MSGGMSPYELYRTFIRSLWYAVLIALFSLIVTGVVLFVLGR